MSTIERAPEIERHPLGATYRTSDGEEWSGFVESVRLNGVRPITLYEGKVLDGWHRYLAARKAYVECLSDTFTGSDEEAAAYINAHNRHIHTWQEIAEARIRQKILIAERSGTKAYEDRRGVNLKSSNLENPNYSDVVTPQAVGEFDQDVASELGLSHEKASKARKNVERIDEETAERIDRCMQASSHQGGDLRREMEQRAQHVQTGEMAPDEFLRIYEEPDSQVATPAPRQPDRPSPPRKKTDKDRIKERDAHIERLQDAVSAMEHQLIEKQTRIEALEQNERILLSQPKGTAGIMDCYNEAASLRAQKATLQSSVAEWMTKYEDKNRLVKSRDKLLKQHGIDVHDPDVWMQTAARNGT